MNNLLVRWQKLDAMKQKALIAVAVTLFLLSTITTIALSQTEYVPLFNHLNTADAAAIIEKLDEHKQKYQLADKGQSILVPDNDLLRLRMNIMAEGLLHDAKGFELFDKSEFGLSDFQQKINYQRALQGELSRTITSLEAIDQARVHLVLPKNQLFSDQQENAKAAVKIHTVPGTNVTKQEIQGIQRLIAAAVQNLQEENVTVIDQFGHVLSYRQDGFTKNDEGQSKEETIELSLANKINKILSRLYENQQAIASVSVRLSGQDIERERDTLLPLFEKNGEKIGALATKHIDSDAKKSNDKRDATGESNKSSTQLTYSYGREHTHIRQSANKITMISIGVLVPKTSTQKEVDQLQRLLADAIGLQEDRGDRITVSPILNPITVAHTVLHKASNEQFEFFALSNLLLYGIIVLLLMTILYQRLKDKGENLTPQQKQVLLSTVQTWAEQQHEQKHVSESN